MSCCSLLKTPPLKPFQMSLVIAGDKHFIFCFRHCFNSVQSSIRSCNNIARFDVASSFPLMAKSWHPRNLKLVIIFSKATLFSFITSNFRLRDISRRVLFFIDWVLAEVQTDVFLTFRWGLDADSAFFQLLNP